MNLRYVAAVCVVLVSIAAQPALGHHGVAWYDYSKTVTAKVTLTQFDWGNPHCKIYFDTIDNRKVLRHWVVEMHPPNALIEHGWTRQTLHPGDEVSLTFRPAKNHSTTGLLEELTLPNGITLRQNLLLLPTGETLSIEEWTRRYALKQATKKPATAPAQATAEH